MEDFNNFVKEEYPDYNLINITKKINSRNIAQHANIINQNPNNIYLIEKRPSNVNIFRDMKYPTHKYMFLHLEKVFVLDNTNIAENSDNFREFMNVS